MQPMSAGAGFAPSGATFAATLGATLVLVLGFALLLERRPGRTLDLIRAQSAATALALFGSASRAQTPGTAIGLAAAGAITALIAAFGARLAQPLVGGRGRTGAPSNGLVVSASWIAAGLVLTALAADLLAGSRSTVLVLGLAAALIGTLLAVRPGPDAGGLLWLAASANGIDMLCAALPGISPVLAPAAAMIAPLTLLAAHATLARVGDTEITDP